MKCSATGDLELFVRFLVLKFQSLQNGLLILVGLCCALTLGYQPIACRF